MVLASYPGGRRFNTPAGREKMPRPRENFRDLPLLAIWTPVAGTVTLLGAREISTMVNPYGKYVCAGSVPDIYVI